MNQKSTSSIDKVHLYQKELVNKEKIQLLRINVIIFNSNDYNNKIVENYNSNKNVPSFDVANNNSNHFVE